MKKFIYKIQPIGTFGRNGNEFDTDLVERIFVPIGEAGFRLVCVSDGFAFFEKEISQDDPEYWDD